MTTIKGCADYFLQNDTDVIIYAGSIDRSGYESFCEKLPEEKKKNLLVVLITYGGDPSAGYRIARAALHHYGCDNFRILIPSYCKSAGTLICIGAHKLIMCDQAELGPLDVQFRKQDEIFQHSSGLDILRGITYLQSDALESFKSYLIDINGGSGLSTKIASEISSKLVIGLYEPLLGQIDPVKLGEMNAALQIANAYGTRLNEKSHSLKANALSKLIHDYPTHGFVIDRAEARKLFERVEKPTEMESVVGDFANTQVWKKLRSDKPIVLDFVSTFKSSSQQSNEEESNEPSGSSGVTNDTAVSNAPSIGNDGAEGVHAGAEGVDESQQLPSGSKPDDSKSAAKRKK